MTIEFYNNSSEDNRLNKTITAIKTCTGTLKEASNILDPSVLITLTDVTGINYAYIPVFGRYYFVTDISVDRQNLYRVSLRCDVLMSYKSQILTCKGILKESTSKNISNYLPSSSWVTLQKDSTFIKTFPSGLLDSGEFILITAGG